MKSSRDAGPRCCSAPDAGCAWGEITGLTEPDIRWMTRQIAVSRQLLRGGKLGPLKTRSSERVVPAPDFVLEALSDHIRAYGLGRRQIVFTRPPAETWRTASGRLLTARKYHPGEVSAQWQALRNARESRGTDPLGSRLSASFAKAVRAVNAKAGEREHERKVGRTSLPPLPYIPEGRARTACGTTTPRR